MSKSKTKLGPVKMIGKRKVILIIAVAVLLVLVGVIATFGVQRFMVNNAKGSSGVGSGGGASSPKVDAAEQKRKDTINSVSEKSDQVLSSGGSISQAAAVYQEAANNTADDQTKAYLYFAEATFYYDNDEYDKALEFALMSDGLRPLSNTEQFIASVYEIKSDNTNAIVFYRKAIDNIDKTDPLSSDDVQVYQNRIKVLGGS